MTLVDMDLFRDSHPRLYRTITKQLNLRGTGMEEVDIQSPHLSTFTQNELHLLFETQPTVQPVVAEPKPAQSLPEQIDIEAEFKRDLQMKTDEASAKARLDQYVVEQGLEASDHNANAIAGWLRRYLKGYWSQQGVDAAVANLGPRGTNALQWKPKAVEPLPPAPTPAPVIEYLSNGEPQLSLNADERTMKAASVAQLKDLVERRRAATNQRYIRRGHGVSF